MVAYRALRRGLLDYELRQVYRGPEAFVDLPVAVVVLAVVADGLPAHIVLGAVGVVAVGEAVLVDVDAVGARLDADLGRRPRAARRAAPDGACRG